MPWEDPMDEIRGAGSGKSRDPAGFQAYGASKVPARLGPGTPWPSPAFHLWRPLRAREVHGVPGLHGPPRARPPHAQKIPKLRAPPAQGPSPHAT